MEVHVLRRGELSKPAEAVGPAFPAALLPAGRPPDFADTPPEKRRAALARWLTAPDNPLTARVLIDRVWGWHFGQAIVRTPNDFGAQGEPPTHPELLDWLARDFRDHGWGLKRLHRQILLSQTYRMASVAEAPALRGDPEDRLLWHFPRRRLEGEAIRDALLSCAGTLNPKRFGPPVVPPLGGEELTGLFDAKGKWPVTPDPAEHTRRSVYLLVRRTFAYPMFAAFDPPETMTSCPRRQETVVPTQALTLLNGPVAREQAAAFARRLRKERGDDPEKPTARAWLLAFGRLIRPAETERALRFLRERADALEGAGARPRRARRRWRSCAWRCSTPTSFFTSIEEGSCLSGRLRPVRLSPPAATCSAARGWASAPGRCWTCSAATPRGPPPRPRPTTRSRRKRRRCRPRPSTSSSCSCRAAPATSTPSTPSRC
jgi:hypothetical protein